MARVALLQLVRSQSKQLSFPSGLHLSPPKSSLLIAISWKQLDGELCCLLSFLSPEILVDLLGTPFSLSCSEFLLWVYGERSHSQHSLVDFSWFCHVVILLIGSSSCCTFKRSFWSTLCSFWSICLSVLLAVFLLKYEVVKMNKQWLGWILPKADLAEIFSTWLICSIS